MKAIPTSIKIPALAIVLGVSSFAGITAVTYENQQDRQPTESQQSPVPVAVEPSTPKVLTTAPVQPVEQLSAPAPVIAPTDLVPQPEPVQQTATAALVTQGYSQVQITCFMSLMDETGEWSNYQARMDYIAGKYNSICSAEKMFKLRGSY